jgi:hypothetical protein
VVDNFLTLIALLIKSKYMNKLIHPLSLNETSLRIGFLHKALGVLGFPVAKDEEESSKAGKNTLKQVRALQKKLNIEPDEKVLMDQSTYSGMIEELKKSDNTEKYQLFSVSGSVINERGEKIKNQNLLALDIDLRGAAVYKTVRSKEEIEKNGGFEWLGEARSEVNGNYRIEFYDHLFQHAERNKADVVVFAVDNKGNITGRSRMVITEDYFDQSEVRDLPVLVKQKEDRTEYEILMGSLMPFLSENKMKLTELSRSQEQISFLAGELDLRAPHIQLAVDADLLMEQCSGKKESDDRKEYDDKKKNDDKKKKDDKKQKKEESAKQGPGKNFIHELFYGAGRQGIVLNWFTLYRKKESELKAAIERSIAENIIASFNEKEIAFFLDVLHTCAVDNAMKFQPPGKKQSLEKLLSVALPESSQQASFVNAYRKFKETISQDATADYKKFWNEYLPLQKEFKEKPALISALLMNQQLIILTGNHAPLIEQLQSNEKISSVTDLFDYDDAKWNSIISKTGVPEFITGENDKEKASNYILQVQSFLNATHPTQKIASMVSKQELAIKDANVAGGIKHFLNANPSFDFQTSKIDSLKKEIRVAAGEHAEKVRVELKRMQRVFAVSPTPSSMNVLMENNLDSAYNIAGYSKRNFVAMYGDKLGGAVEAEAVYQRAEYINTLANERLMKLYDGAYMGAPKYAFSSADHKELMAVIENKLPNYSNLFGSPDICECEHCKSVYGAAAYFVDILRFLSKGQRNKDISAQFPSGKSPLDKFAERRPDLLHLPLTCANSNTIIPYIDLANEVMEYYVYHGLLDEHAAHDTGETAEEELRASPQNFEIEAYRKIKNSAYPFSLPYHQPLDVIRIYSDHLKTERYDVMKGLQKDISAPAIKAIESEALRISQEEYVVLTKEKFDTTADTRTLSDYYGAPASMERLAGFGVSDGIHEFLRRTGVKYTDLVELIKTKFINPHQDKFDFLEELFAGSGFTGTTLYPKFTAIKNGTLDPAADPINGVLVAAGLTGPLFTTWIQTHFDEFNSVITLYQSDSKCDLNTTHLATIKKIYESTPVTASGIGDPAWSKIHRFIRLWRKLGWTIHETDLMLEALGQNDITPDTISKLSSVVLLNKKLKLPLNKLATLWGSIDTYGDKSLYKKLFLNKTVLQTDKRFEADPFGNFLQPDPLDTTTLADHVPAILAAFRMSEDDLNAILKVAILDNGAAGRAIDPSTDKLSIYNLSIIYRYTVLSKILKLKVPDLCLLTKLFSTNPFSTFAIASSQFINISPAITFSFYELAASIKKAGFKAEQLQYIFTGELPAESTAGLNEEKARLTLKNIQEALLAIEQEYPDTLPVPITAEFVKNKLGLTYGGDLSSQLINIAQCSQTFNVSTETGLGIAIPAALSAKYAYDGAGGKISCAGIMNEAEKTLLKALPGSNDNFKNSLDALSVLIASTIATFTDFSIETDHNLGISIPDGSSLKYSYIKSTGRLICKGVMSDNEKLELKGLAGWYGQLSKRC